MTIEPSDTIVMTLQNKGITQMKIKSLKLVPKKGILQGAIIFCRGKIYKNVGNEGQSKSEIINT